MVAVGAASSAITGTVSITFNGYTTSFEYVVQRGGTTCNYYTSHQTHTTNHNTISADADSMTSATCRDAFERLPNVAKVLCNTTTLDSSTTDNVKYNVTFQVNSLSYALCILRVAHLNL